MKNQKKLFLKPLTPVVLDEEQKGLLAYQNYENVLDEAFECEDVCNIALAGPYGAGKSTIMHTYESEHTEKECIHISLAKFDAEVEGKGYTQKELEVKIINQLIHQISEEIINKTNFKVKKDTKFRWVLLYSLLIFLLITSVCYLAVVPASMNDKEVETLFQTFCSYQWNWGVLIIALGSLAALIILIVNRQFISPLIASIQVDKSKIDLADNNKDTDEHQFDRYMDELIYLFRKSKIDAVIFDDIDRFDNLTLFSELREMNYLINCKLNIKSKKKNKNKKIKFFYMVKDELFTNYEQRTKFFDLIIPIIPAMDSSNSFQLLKKLIEETDDDSFIKNMKLDMQYIQMICLYINDYRVLKNIYNEFKVFSQQLKIHEHKIPATNLFAMITYKNLWPEDYAKLQKRDGYVYEVFKNVKEFRKKRNEEIKQEIECIKEAIRKIDSEHLTQIAELDLLYFKNPSNLTNGYFVLDKKSQFAYDSYAEFLATLRNAESVKWRQSPSPQTYGYITEKEISKKEIQSWFESISENPEYARRKDILDNKTVEWRKRKEKEIKQLQDKLNALEESSLSELLISGGYRLSRIEQITQKVDIPINDDCVYEDIYLYQPKELVNIFIRDGMIAEDYEKYMTYFYPYSLSREELVYLNNVRAGENIEQTEVSELTHLDLVVDHLRKQDFRSAALPNHNLLGHAIKTNNTEVANSIMVILRDENRLDFIVKSCKDYIDISIWDFLEFWPEVFDEIIKSQEFIWDDKKMFLIELLHSPSENESWISTLSAESIAILNEHQDEIFAECEYGEVIKCIKVGLKVADFKTTNMEDAKKDLIYNARAFEMNEENVNYIMERETGDREKTVIELLNDNRFSLDQKERLVILMPQIVLNNIVAVNDTDVWDVLAQNNKISYNGENIIALWNKEESFTDITISFVSKHIANEQCDLNMSMMMEFFGETKESHPTTTKMLKHIIQIENIGEGYIEFVKGLQVYYSSFDFEMISGKHADRLLCNTSIIRMTLDNLNYVRENKSKSILYTWIIRQKVLYFMLMKDEELRIEKELHALISDERMSDENKCRLLEFCQESIKFEDKYNSVVVSKILSLGLFDGNYKVLFNRYESKTRYTKSVKVEIEQYAKSHVSELAVVKYKIPKSIFNMLFCDDTITTSAKELLLAGQMRYFTNDEIISLLSVLGKAEILHTIEGGRGKIESRGSIQALLDALVKRQLISSYKIERDEIVLYPKRKVVKA